MRPEIKRFIARGEASRAAKIVNRQGGYANFGEAQRKFFVASASREQQSLVVFAAIEPDAIVCAQVWIKYRVLLFCSEILVENRSESSYRYSS